MRYGNATAREPISKSGRYAGSAKLMSTPKVPSTTPLRILVVGAGVGGISVARGLLRDGHDVTVFEQRPDVRAGGGAVTIWSNGATVLEQLGVDMDGTGQLMSTLQVMTSMGHPLQRPPTDAPRPGSPFVIRPSQWSGLRQS